MRASQSGLQARPSDLTPSLALIPPSLSQQQSGQLNLTAITRPDLTDHLTAKLRKIAPLSMALTGSRLNPPGVTGGTGEFTGEFTVDSAVVNLTILHQCLASVRKQAA